MIFGKHINRYYWKYFPLLFAGLVALIAVDYIQLIVPRLYRLLINGMNMGYVTENGVTHVFDMDFLLDKICLPIIFVTIAIVVCRFVWRACFFGAAIKVETEMRRSMFDVCRGLSQQYYQENKVGNLMSLFTNDLDTIQDCFGSGILVFCDATFLGGLSIVKMARMDPILTLLSMIPMAFLLASGLIISKYMSQRWERRQGAFSAISDFSQESFAGIAVIKAFVKEAKELLAFRKLNEYNEETNVAFVRLSVSLRICVMFLVESVVCVILGYGGYLVHEGRFDAGQLVEFIGYFTAIVWPVMAVSELIDMHAQGSASLKRVSELLDATPDIVDGENVVDDISTMRGDLSFRDLTFCYPGHDIPVLDHINLDIKAGERVGIIGRTGSGKTTLVDLVLRTYNVPDGSIFLDGRDINTIPIRAVRDNCAYVPQDNFLFSDTIENNIRFATDGGTTEAVTEAAKLSDVHDNVTAFTSGYDTVLGERGVTISGGQKQRISIARALMKNAPILILDDSVSAVDVSTEKTILDNLQRVRQGKTTILIAHRISTVEDMDKVVFLDEGKVLAVGTHSELMASCSAYRELVDLQKLDDEEVEK